MEDDARNRRRVQLRREKEKLDKAQEWLQVAETNSDAMDISIGYQADSRFELNLGHLELGYRAHVAEQDTFDELHFLHH